MRNPLEYRLTHDGKTIGDIIFSPLATGNVMPTIVDVGARNGFFMFPECYTSKARLVAFEPNPVEYTKLVDNKTDAGRYGLHTPTFKKIEYHNCALWRDSGDRSFYITEGPGACTLMGETLPEVSTRLCLDHAPNDPLRGKSFYEVHGQVKDIVPIKCRRLDEILGSDDCVDFLKLDVEGAELDVLRGAQELLNRRRILFVYTEFVAVQYYKEHPVFGEVHAFLHQNGFRLLDIDLGHVSYTRDPTPLGPASDRKLLHAGDAYFMLDPDRVPLCSEDRQRLSLVASNFWFNSLAISLLREAKLTSPEDINMIEDSWRRPPLLRLFRYLWRQFPREVLRGLQRVKNLLLLSKTRRSDGHAKNP